MNLGDVILFDSDQAVGFESRPKRHIYLTKTDYHRAPNEYAFLFISSSNYGQCFPIGHSDYPQVLNHDSFVSCNNLVFYSLEYLKETKLRRLGSIQTAHLLSLRNHLAEHDVMEAWQINLACGALAAAIS